MDDIIPIKVQKSIDVIKSDNTSGSIELARKSVEVLMLLSNENFSLYQIKMTLRSLVKAQPAMASIFTFANNLLSSLENNKNQQYSDQVNKYCIRFLSDLDNSDKLVSEKARNLINNNSTIITHSFSSAVLNTLTYAKKSGLEFSVICTESRPKNEGVKLAKLLGSKNINVKLIVDSAIFSFLLEADIIFVGADAVTSNGLVNKIGTLGLVTYAHQLKKPVYALSSNIKFLPKDYKLNLHQYKNPNEILPTKISNVNAINYYFDVTPLNLFTGLITEEKVLKPCEIKEKINHLNIHRNLIKI